MVELGTYIWQEFKIKEIQKQRKVNDSERGMPF